MQTTLLTIAIAFILALLAALVGPHFVDWNKYRAEFQAGASRMTGLEVRLSGPIEARRVRDADGQVTGRGRQVAPGGQTVRRLVFAFGSAV